MDDTAIDLIREMLIITLKIAAPILAIGVVIGLIISIVQSATQIQDQTIAFVPKIVAMIVAAGLLIPWIIERLVTYAAQMFSLM